MAGGARPDIAPDVPGAERTDYDRAVLEPRLRDTFTRLNRDLPTERLKMPCADLSVQAV